MHGYSTQGELYEMFLTKVLATVAICPMMRIYFTVYYVLHKYYDVRYMSASAACA